MRFLVEVVRAGEAPQSLKVDAAGLDEAKRLSAQQGFHVLSARRTGALPVALGFHGRRFNRLVFVEQLRDLLTAGLSLVEALLVLERSSNRDDAQVLGALIARLRDGRRFSDALQLDPAFPLLLIALVRAAEVTSDLPQGLERYLVHERSVAEVKHRVTSIAIYPVVVAIVGSLVMLFLLFYVMPRFARIFEGMTGDLPWSARAMVWWGHWLQDHVSVLLAAGGACVSVAVALLMSNAGRAAAAKTLMNAAPLRARLRTYFLARWYRATGLLVSGGIPLPEALAMTLSVLPEALRRDGLAVDLAVRDGFSPADAYARSAMTTPVAQQLMRAGERTGDFGGALTRIAQFHEAEVARTLERSMKTAEPIVMTLIGLGVGVVVVLMYLPIFELAAAIQ